MAPAAYTITAVDQVSSGEADFFRVTFLRDDRQLHGYFFPVETLAWRAAELGLDPRADSEQLLDIVLHEPFTTGGVARVTIRVDPTLPVDPLDVIRQHHVAPERVQAIHNQVRRARPAEPPADESAILRHETL